jgi:uncharacterized protein (TIGR02246 family)
MAAGCRAGPPDFTEAEKAAVVQTVTSLTKDFVTAASRADLDATFRFFSSDADAAVLNLGTRYTRQAIIELYRPIYASLRGQEIDIGQPVVAVLSPEAAVLSTQGRFTATYRSGAQVSSQFAWTLVWVRRNGQWSVLHAHQSFPEPLKTP